MDPEEHAEHLLTILQSLCDSFLRVESGATLKRLRDFTASKLAAMATVPPALTSLATVFGTASTGTAISSLSGAALTSASLAWLGGSVAGGLMVISGTTIAMGWMGYRAIQFFKKKNRRERHIEDLPEDEKILYEGMLGIAQILTEKKASSPMLLTVWSHNLEPILGRLIELASDRFEDWNEKERKKLNKDINKLQKLRDETEYRLSPVAKFSIASFSAVTTKFFIEAAKFTAEDELVMDAYRRSTNQLSEDATTEEIGAYIRSFEDPHQRQGLLNNVKGIYHELAYADRENSDNDDWFVEISADTNEPDVDVWLYNEKTGERIPYQLKASDSASSAKEHYQGSDVQVLATEEIVNYEDNIHGSGFSNEEITAQTESTTDKLAMEGTVTQIVQETATAAAVAAAIGFSLALAESLKSGKPVDKLASKALNPAKEATAIAIVMATITEFTIL